MKNYFLLFPLVALTLLSCSTNDPVTTDKPTEAFNVTIDGEKIATGPATAVLYHDYLLINTYGEFDFTYLIYLPDALPGSMGVTNYSSLAMTNPELLLTNIDGGSGQVLSLTLDMVGRYASGTFTAVLMNPSDASDFSNITEANFSAVKFQIATDTAQIYGELSQVMDGVAGKANLVYATDTSLTDANLLANAHGEYEVLFKNVPKTPGSYSMEIGNFNSASGISMQVNIFDDAIYSNVQSGGTINVISYDPETFELVFNYDASLQEPGGNLLNITDGYIKVYTGGIH